ncbi:dihydroneopterin aldolase [bacterium]|nr:dihydroneopterin aldolase [bacterium]
MTTDTYKIDISGLRLFAYHGVFPEENKLGQEFKIDLLLQVRRSETDGEDNLKSVLSYWNVIERVKQLFTGKIFKLLETAAQTILDDLGCYSQIQYAKIHLKKLTPPIPVTVDYVGVILEKKY